ncbi:helix-turn-helix domain-containing protein [Pseudochryseolinea flava]|uniref:HTH araC/xylS-type domain-containing protein n=1 Tax=Pseudochryseolinea flava TaxID=2059302 RepID=A0A364Y9W8_9BACT|nr:helix-turn-helix domain-containing protein [Pseudochryseolinea flava]RAW02698.1 hypothetical protein DQQ10_00900 [Pseudochryseolinea flava]
MNILYTAATLQGIILAVLLARTKVNQPANKVLAVLLILLSFHLVLVGNDNRSFFMSYPHLSRVSWIIGSLYWPLIFLFVQSVTENGERRNRYDTLWFFIPFVVLLILMLPYYMLPASEKRSLLNDFNKASEADFGLINQIVSLLHLFFQTFNLIYYLRLEKKWRNEYSAVESIRIGWLKQFLMLTLIATILAVMSFFFRTWNIPVFSNLYSYHFIGIVAIFYWMSYKALSHPVIFGLSHVPSVSPEPVTITVQAQEKYAKSGVDEHRLQEIFDAVQTVLRDEKIYTKKDLTLSELADKIGIQRHQVSQAINAIYDGNFFDLINAYRVDEFKRLASDPSKKHLTLLGISQESGFNSKASFYAIFKKKTGLTPSEYIEMQSNEAK